MILLYTTHFLTLGRFFTVSPLALNEKTFSKVITVVDASIASSDIFAVHALSSDSTVFLSGSDLVKYLKSLETEEVKVQEMDFAAPAETAAPSKAQKEKEDAKIEGAVQIAIGVKKEVDFPTWYTNVSASF
jgi:prolyl-tRNA synthetase